MFGMDKFQDSEFEEKFNKWNQKTLGYALKTECAIRSIGEKKPYNMYNKGILTKKLENNLPFLNINQSSYHGDIAFGHGPQDSGFTAETSQKAIPGQLGSRPDIHVNHLMLTEKQSSTPRRHPSEQTLTEKWVSNLAFLGLRSQVEERKKQGKRKSSTVRLSNKWEQNLKFLDMGQSKESDDSTKYKIRCRGDTTNSKTIDLDRNSAAKTEDADLHGAEELNSNIDCQNRESTEKLNSSLYERIENKMLIFSQGAEKDTLYKENFKTAYTSSQHSSFSHDSKYKNVENILKHALSVKPEPDSTDIFQAKRKDFHIYGMKETNPDIEIRRTSDTEMPKDDVVNSKHTSLKLNMNENIEETVENMNKGQIPNNLVLDEIPESSENKLFIDKNSHPWQSKAEEKQELETGMKKNLNSVVEEDGTESTSGLEMAGISSPVKKSCRVEKPKRKKKRPHKAIRKSSSSGGQNTTLKDKKCKSNKKQNRAILKKYEQNDETTGGERTSLQEEAKDQTANLDKLLMSVEHQSEAMWIVNDEPLPAEEIEELTDSSLYEGVEPNKESMAWDCDFEIADNCIESEDDSANSKIKPYSEMNLMQIGPEFYGKDSPLQNQYPLDSAPSEFLKQQSEMHKLEHSLLEKADSGMPLTDTEQALLEVSETVNCYLWEKQVSHGVLMDFQRSIDQLEEEGLWVLIHALLRKLRASKFTYARLLAISQKTSVKAKVVLQVFLDLLYYELFGTATPCSVDIIHTVGEIATQLRLRDAVLE